jgi:hypothetical protein
MFTPDINNPMIEYPFWMNILLVLIVIVFVNIIYEIYRRYVVKG